MVSRAISNPIVSSWAAQCDKFYKWRITLTHEEFEEIRSRFVKEPFNFNNKPNSSCDDPACIDFSNLQICSFHCYTLIYGMDFQAGDALRNARMSKLHITVDDAKCCLSGDNMETQLHLFSEYSWTTRVKAELEMFGQESQHKGERWNNVYVGFRGGTRNSSRRILQQQFGVPGYITLGKRELEVL
ncbi:putative histidine-containing phosphotransfer protein 1-like [Capsicum annuum]|nr:putative histidine-containing phosphotransfer protein 1-like [Capsicum annuum]